MTALLLTPVVLSLLVLAAHFLRDGHLALVALVLALIALLPVRRPWVPRVLQLVLVLAAAEWVRTLVQLRSFRIALGQPHGRMTAILGGVALFTALAALVFQAPRLRRRYRRADARADADADARTEP